MSQRENREREERLMRILEEESLLEGDELREHLAGSPELLPLFDAVMKLQGALDEAADTAGADLGASRPVDEAAAQRVRDRVRDLAREAPAPHGKESSRSRFGIAKWTLLAAAALALLVAVWAPFAGDSPAERQPVTLGSALEGLAPSGPVDAFSTFRWSFDGLGAGRFEVQVFRADTGELVTMERGLKETRWQPGAEETAEWPDRIRWIVTAYDASGALLDSAQASAERSPR